MTGDILTLNAGSSSLKFAVFAPKDSKQTAHITGKIAGIGRAPEFSARDANGMLLVSDQPTVFSPTSTHEDLVAFLLDWLEHQLGNRTLAIVGHRIVHGGQTFSQPVRIDDTVLSELDGLVPLAPLHQPHNLATVRAVAAWRPDLPQIACFDTGFHRTQDTLATLFALPRALSDEGIIRYGFHGLSYDYIAGVLPDHLGPKAEGRIIVAHLGNGASMCAMRNRQSVATSMGFTALDGLMMGSRCGALDPGVVLYLLQSKGMSPAEIETLLYEKSGLLGVSGISNNMQVLEDSDAPQALEAIDLFVHRAASTLAGLVAALGGLDALVFTAGIGENSARVRRSICARLEWLGIAIDHVANERNETRISMDASAIDVLVLPTNEEAVIAAGCRRFVEPSAV
ncbi:acetate kinase [Poseidonocella pacifica]|uniref:Acetate kinase n=1 Tax=Poseidonocella pacifica TaxID=871651 RepID=A0A1I0UYN2_9RHOB|nr:acetate/propionate family kinase [Poseidonocella pacifica]SFA69003.1 acetate kinase [Poseidonocella pacifica]